MPLKKGCIRNGQSNCNVRGRARFDQIALNCDSRSLYCRKITSGRNAGLIKRSTHKDPENNNPTWIAIPRVLKCRPQLAYMARKLALGGPPSSVKLAKTEKPEVLGTPPNAGDPDLLWPDLNLKEVDNGVLQRLKNFFVGLIRMFFGGGNADS